MKKILIIGLYFSIILSLFSQEADSAKKEDKKYSATFSVNSDAFFGLTPVATLGIPLNETVSVTAYSIFWSGIGNGVSPSFGHWTEFGGGLNFSLMDGALNLNPQIGILNGTLLSRGGLSSGSGNAMFNEGIVPNFILLYDKSNIEVELYGGYYLGTRANSGAVSTPLGVTEHYYIDPTIANIAATTEGSQALTNAGLKASYFGNRDARNNYTHFWAFPGYKINEWLSSGLHWEELRYRPSGGDGDFDRTLYKWTGLYVKFKAGNGSLRFAFGNSITNNEGLDTLTGTSLRDKVAKLRTSGSSNEAALNTAVTEWLTTTQKASAMQGTYYRVTYTQEF
jgi:hypothetical protein